ncbi:MAG: ribonucleoside triphosphate reductase [Candidatus Norongarragalinales archaeon]
MPVPEKIIKRDGTQVPFNKEKIANAIFKAAKAVGGSDFREARKIADVVVELLAKESETPTVEHVQNLVEKTLIERGHAKTAKAYILYRDQHARIRDLKNAVGEAERLVDDYLNQSDWRVRENSNMGYSLQGLNNHISSSIISRYWLNRVYPPEIREAHSNADFHLHDLGLLSVYCCGWELSDLINNGFGGVAGKIESKAPSHFRVALGQVVNFFYTMQGEAAGAQAFSNFDTYLAPFIRYDSLGYREVKQALQEFIFNINVPTRVGFQTPFTNITLDLTVPHNISEEKVVIGGREMAETHADFQYEMDLFNIAFAEVMMKGDAKGRIFTFPIPTYNITRDFDWDSPVSDKIFEMTAKYGLPYFSNFVNSDMKPEDARSMCCRLRLDNRELRKKGGGLFGANPLTGSIGVVTINLPRIGFLSKNETEFFERLDRLADLAKESLEIKRRVLEKFTEENLYPYSKHYLRNIKQAYGAYWENHFSTIGILGMNEALENIMGENIASESGRSLALKTLDHLRARIGEYQEETGHIYNLEATPGEGTTYRFAKSDKKNYPGIKVANEKAWREQKAAPYYTNSTHLPVNYTDDIFLALDLQDELQAKYTGGTVLHGFLGERMPDAQATKKLVRTIAEKYRLPYYTITPTFSVCNKHGYLSGEHEYCPVCDVEIGFTPAMVVKAVR